MEAMRIERGLETREPFAQEANAPSRMDANVVGVALDPLDVIDRNDELSVALGNDELLEIASAPLGGRGRRTRFGVDTGANCARLGHSSNRALDCRAKTRVGDRLDEEVECLGVERANCVFVVR